VFAGHQLGAAVAAWGAGHIRTVTFTYSPAVYVAAAACGIAALLALMARRRTSGVSGSAALATPPAPAA